MGVVYKAEDTRLKRTVALKFLPPEFTCDAEAKERFIHEAQAASGLQHPNICVVYDIDETPDGQMFISMEYLEGSTLKQRLDRGPLRTAEAVGIALQAAHGLTSAHAHGIVHRDIKPANILITTDGAVKIVDFGLAKLGGRSMLTKAGSTLGTVAYMSPEQARGEDVDGRTDLWSLAVVLYEMLSGKRPFDADFEQATIFRILNDPALPAPGIPAPFETFFSRALAKEPASRYTDAGAMAESLQTLLQSLEHRTPERRPRRTGLLAAAGVAILCMLAGGVWWMTHGGGPAAGKKSIAVLPITTISRAAADQEFADGLHDHLLTQLSRIRDLTVISRQSVLQYRETQKRSREIAGELGVGMLMEASVQRSGSRLRMQVQLIDGASEGHLWANTYDRQLTDIFAVQSDLAQSIVNAMQATITPEEKAALAKPWTTNPQALELYMKGANLWTVAIGKAHNLQAADYLDQAARLDTTFAAAYALASHVHTSIYTQGTWDSSPSRLAKAQATLHRARELDPGLPETHLAAGSYARQLLKDLDAAEREYESALALRPNDYEIAHELAFVNVQRRRLDRAQSLFERCEILNPLAPSGGMDSRMIQWNLRRWDDALRSSERYIERLPEDPLGYIYHAMMLCEGRGDLEGAGRVLRQGEEWRDTHPPGPWSVQGIDVFKAGRAYEAYLHRNVPETAKFLLKSGRAFGPRRLPYNVLWGCRNEPGIRPILDSVVNQSFRLAAADSTNRRALPRLAFALAIRGSAAEARLAADRARAHAVTFDDPWMSQEVYLEWIANAYLLVGDHTTALDILEDLLSRPSSVSVGKLRIDPIYDPLRDEPRFRALLSKNDRL